MVLEQECCDCGLIKSHDEFGKDKRRSGGLKSKCRACQRIYNKEYHRKNKQKLNAYSRQYNRDHAEKISTRTKEYYINNREVLRARSKEYRSREDVKLRHAQNMRKWRKENPELSKQRARKSYKKHKEARKQGARDHYRKNPERHKGNAKRYREENLQKVLYWNRQRKARQESIPGSHTFDQWIELGSFFDNSCPCCNEKDVQLSVDHIIPVSWDNASDWITNIQPLCRSCNSSKNNSRDTDYRPEHVKAWAQKQVENET